MIDLLVQVDTWLLLKLNAGAANAVFDWIMPIVTELRNWAADSSSAASWHWPSSAAARDAPLFCWVSS